MTMVTGTGACPESEGGAGVECAAVLGGVEPFTCGVEPFTCAAIRTPTRMQVAGDMEIPHTTMCHVPAQKSSTPEGGAGGPINTVYNSKLYYG